MRFLKVWLALLALGPLTGQTKLTDLQLGPEGEPLRVRLFRPGVGRTTSRGPDAMTPHFLVKYLHVLGAIVIVLMAVALLTLDNR